MENSNESNENERLKMRIAVMEESVKSSELECKASRETMLRLVAELDQERRRAASSAAALGSLKVFDGLVVGRSYVETEKQSLTERLEASKRVIEAARQESHCLKNQVEELERRTQAAEGKLQAFLEKVVGLLQEKSEDIILPTERDVLQTLDNLCSEDLPEMEVRLCCVSDKLREETERYHNTQLRAQPAEQQVQDQEELVTLRQSLAQLSERQRELVDFRMVVSQMLGLDASALALPNYEIIKLLETLLHNHCHHHHLHHQVNMPWYCSTHLHHLQQI